MRQLRKVIIKRKIINMLSLRYR